MDESDLDVLTSAIATAVQDESEFISVRASYLDTLGALRLMAPWDFSRYEAMERQAAEEKNTTGVVLTDVHALTVMVSTAALKAFVDELPKPAT